MYLFKTPSFIKRLFSSLQWDNKEMRVLLTFDDGPTKELTSYILDTLKIYDVKAVFFCVGENVKNNPALYQRILEEGHIVGNHTMNHLNKWQSSENDYLNNILEASVYIKSKLFRPPYGRLSLSTIKNIQKLGYEIMMWSVLTGDFDSSLSKEKCLKKTISSIKSNSILVFHDNVKATEKMKYVLEYLLKNQKDLNIKF